MSRWETDAESIAPACLRGALAAGLIHMAIAAVILVNDSPAQTSAGWDASAVMQAAVILLVVGFFTTMAYGLGIALLGLPLWWLLHRLGLRQWPVALAAGYLCVFLFMGGLTLHRAVGDPPALLEPALWSLPGAAVGFVVWRRAYTRFRG